MASFPHEYKISVKGGPDGNLPVKSEGLPDLETNAPAEFGGPGDVWSPETMLTGAVANCLILTFRALARAAKVEWSDLDVDCVGEVNKGAGGISFTKFTIKAKLTITGDTDEDKAKQTLENSKKHCLVTASLNSETEMEAEVVKE